MRNKKQNTLTYDKMAKKHSFFLNPYKDHAFTCCAKCKNKTKIRKLPFAIHVEPNFFLLLNKNCRYCPACDLIIIKQERLEQLLVAACKQLNREEIIGNNYFVIGTAERSWWRESMKKKMTADQIMKRVYIFKNILSFKAASGGWMMPNK